jgi:hypothetical protein
MKIPYSYETLIRMDLVFDTESLKSKYTGCNLYLNCDARNEQLWKGENGLPNTAGVKANTEALITGLANSIHYAHENGLWDSAEHLRYIIARLEKMFAEPTKIETKIYTSPSFNDK